MEEPGEGRPRQRAVVEAETAYGRTTIALDQIEAVEEVQRPEHPRGEDGVRIRCRSGCWMWIKIPSGRGRSGYYDEIVALWTGRQGTSGTGNEG